MSQMVQTPTKTLTAAGALGQYLRVKTPGALALAGSTDIAIGVMEYPCLAAGPATVRLRTAQGTVKMVASEAISAGDPVYAAASGKVASSGTVFEGIAMEAAADNDDIIEVMWSPNVDVSQTIDGTNAATFQVDADLGKPRAALGSQTGGTGDYKAIIRPPATLGADRIFTLAGDANATLVNEATVQNLSGKTLTGILRLEHTVTPVAAAGSSVSDAGQLPSVAISHITSDSAAKGVKLPTGAKNDVHIVINDSSTAAELYAASGGTVNGLSADASVVVPASKGLLCVCTAADTWIAFDLPAKATAS